MGKDKVEEILEMIYVDGIEAELPLEEYDFSEAHAKLNIFYAKKAFDKCEVVAQDYQKRIKEEYIPKTKAIFTEKEINEKIQHFLFTHYPEFGKITSYVAKGLAKFLIGRKCRQEQSNEN